MLYANRDRVQSVVYAAESKQLLSAGDDAVVIVWNVDVKRQEVSRSDDVLFACDCIELQCMSYKYAEDTLYSQTAGLQRTC